MSTKYAKVPSANSGKGFITHSDLEISKLQFSVLAEKDGFMYIKIEGEDSKIGEWIKRVMGTETTSTVVDDIIATFPPPIEKRVEKLETDIETIKSDVTSLKTVAGK
jgi:hypothetical protein